MSLKIGWSEVDITPHKRASLIGQFAERISEYVEKPITATALALDTGNDHAIIVSVDVNGVSYNLVEAIRERLKDNTVGIDPLKTIFAAVHTHTAPTYPRPAKIAKYIKAASFSELLKEQLTDGRKYIPMESTGGDDIITPEEYFVLLTDCLTKVVLEAWNNRVDSSFANAFGRAAVGMCRRAVFANGTAKMWGDTHKNDFVELEGGSDTGLELLYTFDGENELTGVVANLACPAQCVQHRKFISPDFWGEVKKNLRNHFGKDIFVLGLCSIAGDQCPVDLVRFVEPESDLNDPNIIRNNPPKRVADPSMFDISGMKKVGRRIANEIIAVYEDGDYITKSDVILQHCIHIADLPIRKVSEEELKTAKNQIEEYLQNKCGDVDYNDVGNLTGPLGVLRHKKIQETINALDSELHIIRLGNIAIATNPFEPFIKYGNKIKAASNAEQTFLVQLANGIDGYIPTEKAEKGGHYSAFVASGVIGPEGGDLMVKETVEAINRLLSEK